MFTLVENPEWIILNFPFGSEGMDKVGSILNKIAHLDAQSFEVLSHGPLWWENSVDLMWGKPP